MANNSKHQDKKNYTGGTRTRNVMFRIIAGATKQEICMELNIAPSAFDTVTESPLFKSELLKLRQNLTQRLIKDPDAGINVQEALHAMNPYAINMLVKMMINDGVPIATRRLACKDIIDYNLTLEAREHSTSVTKTASFIQKGFEVAKKRREEELAKKLKEEKEEKDAERKRLLEQSKQAMTLNDKLREDYGEGVVFDPLTPSSVQAREQDQIQDQEQEIQEDQEEQDIEAAS